MGKKNKNKTGGGQSSGEPAPTGPTPPQGQQRQPPQHEMPTSSGSASAQQSQQSQRQQEQRPKQQEQLSGQQHPQQRKQAQGQQQPQGQKQQQKQARGQQQPKGQQQQEQQKQARGQQQQYEQQEQTWRKQQPQGQQQQQQPHQQQQPQLQEQTWRQQQPQQEKQAWGQQQPQQQTQAWGQQQPQQQQQKQPQKQQQQQQPKQAWGQQQPHEQQQPQLQEQTWRQQQPQQEKQAWGQQQPQQQTQAWGQQQPQQQQQKQPQKQQQQQQPKQAWGQQQPHEQQQPQLQEQTWRQQQPQQEKQAWGQQQPQQQTQAWGQQQPQQQQQKQPQKQQQQQQPKQARGQQQQQQQQKQPQEQQQPQQRKQAWGQQQPHEQQQPQLQEQTWRQQQPQHQKQAWGQQQPPQQQEFKQQPSSSSYTQSSGAVPKQAGEQPSPQRQTPIQAASQTASSRSSRTSISQSSSSTSITSSTSQRSIQPGTLGIKGEVEANYLVLNLGKMPDIAYHYDVTITPDRPKKFFRSAFKQFINTHLPGQTVAFDGVKSCYMVERLPNPVYEGDVKIADSGSRQIQFRVSIKLTDNPEVELRSLKTYHNERVFDKPMRALQCIEVVLANDCHNKGIRAGRSFFTRPNKTMDLDEGYELYTGLYQAAILGEQPYLNVDISHKSFPMPYDLITYLESVLNCNRQSNLDPRNLQRLSKHLKNLKVVYNPPPSFGAGPRSYKVNDISREPAATLSFTTDNGEKFTVQKYFQSRGFNLRYPNLNCVVAGSTIRPNYFPMELCSIEAGQAIRRKDGSRQVQKMIRFAATSTDERKRKIMQKLEYFNINADRLVQAFGISVGEQFIKVPMRLLKAPAIEYHSSKYVEPRNGSWRNLPFLETGAAFKKSGHKWAIIYTPSRFLKYPTLMDLANMLYNGAKRMGINLDAQKDIKETGNIVATLEEYKRNDYDLVIVVIPGFGTSYADIKQKAELVCGLLTQCIKEQTLNRGVNDMLISNLLLKVNSKLNGSNHKISANHHVVLDHVMFMGADVTHPSPDQNNIPSVVGVAASHDLNGSVYNMQYRLQEPAKEEIVDMRTIAYHHLRVYFQKQKCYPKSIIYYRDGVSDGQFQKVEMLELGAIRAVCKELGITPKITCIIVVKRHHTRFFPTKPTGDKWNNVLPGTVVDQKIVHPNETQFFMVSHQSIQGTAKPTRYNVIVDDAKMSMDDLQKMTNNLCYMFPRCNRAVSYPAPAYLAHLVAARGRVYIDGPPLRRALPEEYKKRLINERFMNTTPMFFV
ncbi:protein argonaute-2 [Anastrepha ludens]|uniref:protein argonaute-2 n=1 Tax=Anastrepha ludens TaxID=28586 RepID=UPI0023B18140|nr:protein argonaute-2 [Anastrepha ludens]